MGVTLLAMEAFERIFDIEKLDPHLQFFAYTDRVSLPHSENLQPFTMQDAVDIALAATTYFFWLHPEYVDCAILSNAVSFGKHVFDEAVVLKAQHPTLCARAIVDSFDTLLT